MATQQDKFDRFLALHQADSPFLIANAWDAGSARLLTSLGVLAIATTSAGYAFSKGKRDSFATLSRSEILENAREVVEATDLPVSADLEEGFGAAPEACEKTIHQAIQAGLVGGTLEDATGDPENPIFEFDLSVERVRAACDAAKDQPFLLTARAENFIYGRPDLDDTIRRLQAYQEAGADVLYAPGLPSLEAVATVCRSVDVPVNVLVGLVGPRYTVAELAEAGAQRISVGGSFFRATYGALKRAAEEVLGPGTFEYAKDAIPDAALAALMSDARSPSRE